MRFLRLVIVFAGGGLVAATPAFGQGYRVRFDARYQGVSYRGFSLDSTAVGDAQVSSNGSAYNSDGYLLNCSRGAEYCTYYRQGPGVRSHPVIATVDADAWGFGVPGLRFSTKARLGTDLASPDAWPGTDPQLQLIEGFVEYATGPVVAQAGRSHVVTRLGWTGFDGAKAEVRPLGRKVKLLGYGGWGLARGVALPVTSAALNPLDEFQPRDRQIIFGAGVGCALPQVLGEAVWQREIDPESDNVASDYRTLDLDLRLARNLSLTGGAYYDLTMEQVGSADAQATYLAARGAGRLTVGARRYRPRFDVWTIWGAFSPVAYNAGFGSLSISPIGGLEIRTAGEIYEFDDTETSNRLAQVESDGWRWRIGAAYSGLEDWRFDGGYWVDKGIGSRSVGYEGLVTYSLTETTLITGHAEWLQRPLEFRFNDTDVRSYALRVDHHTVAGLRINAELRRYDEVRQRPDAARLSWDQWRLNLGLSFTFGTDIRGGGIHPAILRIPEGRGIR
jgi:hypothetical protein